MLEGYLKSGKGIGCIDRGGPKNPCVFGEQYFPELRSLSGDVGGKKVLCRHPEDVYRQKAEKEEVWDMDEKRTVIVRGGGDRSKEGDFPLDTVGTGRGSEQSPLDARGCSLFLCV